MKKYTVISNISYALKNIWRWDKKFYLFFIPAIPMAVLMPLAASYFPKALIDPIESGKSIRNIIFIICAYFGMLLISICSIASVTAGCACVSMRFRCSISTIWLRNICAPTTRIPTTRR